VHRYRQRADTCGDPELREILEHNKREGMEHAAVLLEGLRRGEGHIAEQLGTYLGRPAPSPTRRRPPRGRSQGARSRSRGKGREPARRPRPSPSPQAL
jgi:hypothetical protein